MRIDLDAFKIIKVKTPDNYYPEEKIELQYNDVNREIIFMISRILPFSLILMAGLSLSTLADDKNLGTPHITVSGKAVTEIVPDQLTWVVQVKHIHQELSKAAEEHSKKVALILEIIKKIGVSDKDLQTANMEFGENQIWREREFVKEGYFANTMITFKLSDLTRYNELWMALSAQSNVSVRSAAYEHSKKSEYQTESRNKALLNAKEKATAMASVLNAKIGEVLSIAEYTNSFEASRYGATPDAFAGSAPSPTTAPGVIPITMEIEVTFRLLNGAK